jgi:ankyrin repeat protein
VLKDVTRPTGYSWKRPHKAETIAMSLPLKNKSSWINRLTVKVNDRRSRSKSPSITPQPSTSIKSGEQRTAGSTNRSTLQNNVAPSTSVSAAANVSSAPGRASAPAAGSSSPAPGASLWSRGYDKKKAEDPELMSAYEAIVGAEVGLSRIDDPATMQKLIDLQLQKVEDRKWKLQVGSQPIVIREQVGRLVRAVMFAKDFISPILSAEPHAGLGDIYNKSPLYYAVSGGMDLGLIKCLIECGGHDFPTHSITMRTAIERSNDIAEFLLANGLELPADETECHYLLEKSQKNEYEGLGFYSKLAMHLMDRQPSFQFSVEEIAYALTFGDIDLVAKMKKCSGLGEDEWSAAWMSMVDGWNRYWIALDFSSTKQKLAESMSIMMESDKSVLNAPVASGMTLLCMAARCRNWLLVHCLLRRGANVLLKDDFGWDAILYLADGYHMRCLDLACCHDRRQELERREGQRKFTSLRRYFSGEPVPMSDFARIVR